MEYKLYTLVDITSTNQYRPQVGLQTQRWKEQNFSSVIQTLGMRANVSYLQKPIVTNVKGCLVGFDIEHIVKIWRFDFSTEQDLLYGSVQDPTLYLREDFNAVPYIAGLGELMQQRYSVFVTEGINRNIVFHQKQ